MKLVSPVGHVSRGPLVAMARSTVDRGSRASKNSDHIFLQEDRVHTIQLRQDKEMAEGARRRRWRV